jgi:deoxyribodipyrimidine photo-lyase
MKVNVFWFRRDLRINDNIGLNIALASKNPVIGIFIFDDKITLKLQSNDARISFIYKHLNKINNSLKKVNSSLLILKGTPIEVFINLIKNYEIDKLYSNIDYEPYGIDRDAKITSLLESNQIKHFQYKDHVVFSPNEILKDNGEPYTVYTPYKNKWLLKFKQNSISTSEFVGISNFHNINFQLPTIDELGFEKSNIDVVDFNNKSIKDYAKNRDFPFLNSGSFLGVHLRFGTISLRDILSLLGENDSVFLSELIWREFFMMITYHYPFVKDSNFKKKYDNVIWRNDQTEFQNWCDGKTGYPIVDAGMRELNQTGYMHNRVRMIVAGFLCKHLLIDWKWGEKYFSEKLLDYELSSNNGNWQWAAGTGCDSAPYFRIFNPFTQQKKFDKDLLYVKKWIPNYDPDTYIDYVVDHKFARKRALDAYKLGLS